MKLFALLALITTFLTPAAFATSRYKCENYAKGAAIRAYKAEVGTIQGSEGMEYNARKLRTDDEGNIFFRVHITEGNEDGESWTFNYLVKTSDSCRILLVKKLSEQ